MSELPSYGEMAAEKLKERSKASGGELKNLVSYSTHNPAIRNGCFGTFYSYFKMLCIKYIKFLAYQYVTKNLKHSKSEDDYCQFPNQLKKYFDYD